MARSKIIRELINGETSVVTSLQRLLIIVNDLDNKELNTWIKNELNGYSTSEGLPEYRKNLPNIILYSGINGSFQVSDQPLSIQAFGEYKKDIYELNSIKNSILELENTSKGEMIFDLTMYAPVIRDNMGISCFSIKMKFGKNISDIVISNVKTRIIEALLLLEKEFGSLDEYYIDEDKLIKTKVSEVNRSISSIIFTDGAEY